MGRVRIAYNNIILYCSILVCTVDCSGLDMLCPLSCAWTIMTRDSLVHRLTEKQFWGMHAGWWEGLGMRLINRVTIALPQYVVTMSPHRAGLAPYTTATTGMNLGTTFT